MNLLHSRVSALALVALFLGANQALLGDEKKTVLAAFGTLEATSPEAAQARALDWLKEIGKADPATTGKVETLWKQEERSVLERLADTFVLADETAARLLGAARDPLTPAPTEVPAVLKDAKKSLFYRTNLGLAYARLLSNRRVHEEALEALKIVQPEQVVDPATYLFHRSVCEHALLQKNEASRSIGRLLDETPNSPERYKMVGALMLLDMQTWKEKDLGAIARKMDNIERRLDLARGGPHTQKLQKEVVLRLDEMIKELENKAKKQNSSGADPNDGGCPDGGQPQPGQGGANNPSAPMQDSQIANQGGTGRVDQAKLRKLMAGWGSLPERERARALQELTRGMSSSHREAIENYFRNLAQK